MEPKMLAKRRHKVVLMVLAFGLGSVASAIRAPAAAQEGMAPGQASAPTVEALLPRLLRTDMTGPVPFAAIKFGPEFWAALEADAGERAQYNLFPRLFSGGLLFGVGPLDSVLAAARGEKTATGWTAPKTLRALLVLDLDEPNVQASVQGQVFPLKTRPGHADPTSLLNHLEFIFFPLRMGGGQATLADLARRMTLVITGIAPGVTQTFTWELAPPDEPLRQEQAPLVAASPSVPQLRRPAQRGLGSGHGGWGLGAPSPPPAAAPAPPLQPEGGPTYGMGGLTEAREGAGTGLASGLSLVDATALYPLSRAASNVGASDLLQNSLAQDGFALTEAYATIEQVSRTEGSVTLDYRTSPAGRQEVELLDDQGHVARRIAAGPAPATGRALASWKQEGADTAQRADRFFVLVRNSVPTPLGVQVSEATSPLPSRQAPNEPEAVVAPTAPTIVDVSVAEMSVAGDLLQVRARVAPIPGPEGALRLPPLIICVTDETGNLVRTITPTPPLPGKDYVFAWDATNNEGKRVPDGRYILRLEARADSRHGSARSELRYWIDVPLEITQRRLALLGPLAVESLQAELLGQEPGQIVFTYAAPQPGHMRAFVANRGGRVVRHLLDTTVPKGQQKLVWDGTDDNGAPLPDGSYIVNFELDGGDHGAWWGVVTLDDLPSSADR